MHVTVFSLHQASCSAVPTHTRIQRQFNAYADLFPNDFCYSQYCSILIKCQRSTAYDNSFSHVIIMPRHFDGADGAGILVWYAVSSSKYSDLPCELRTPSGNLHTGTSDVTGIDACTGCNVSRMPLDCSASSSFFAMAQ
ncbi:uncharacterized protein MYCFIDRAFT_169079 [Pseudocercospora fijiensis CIRAD86]|uniref:Uncharacterized protein n=1 Tax=Pseudocercospora fijiensis (strain CIRAD86) TaxID=383855 RepID=N1Q8M2_PSEFD|nr:uncharacterized protein MYCFIDRAFT_169079 [Pseudocercospora fijiensis CIRAD86]EME87223.1 hypothetical protein MYCFIDRAFT_169079 [Pseudocercospora fijiensis CIRAD86]